MPSRNRRRDDHASWRMGPSPAVEVSEYAVLQPLVLTLPQVAQQLGLSQTRVYQLVALEGLPTVKIGRSTRVLYGSLVQWVKEHEQRAT